MPDLVLGSTTILSDSSGTPTIQSGVGFDSGVTFPADHIIQIKQNHFNNQPSRASTSFGDFSTPITATISNCKSSSKILCWVNLSVSSSRSQHQYFRLIDDHGNTTLGPEGDDGLFGVYNDADTKHIIATFWYLVNSPTFSSNEFRLRVHAKAHAGTLYINRRGYDTSFGRLTSNIILMEVAG